MRRIYGLAVAAAVLTLGAVGMPAPAQAQTEGRNGATGRTVIMVTYPGGAFRRQADGSWNEVEEGGRVIARLRETGRDDWSVYLAEIGSGGQVQIDLYHMIISVPQDGGGLAPRYAILSAEAPGRVTLPGTSATTVRRVDYRDGWFQADGNGRWTEYQGTSPAYRFVLRSATSDAITLFDASRNTGVELNLTQHMVRISFQGAPYENLYPITAIDGAAPRRVATPPYIPPGASYAVQTNFKIEAGPITSQAEANAKCPALAVRVHGNWTQGWERRDGVNSVCVIAFP